MLFYGYLVTHHNRIGPYHLWPLWMVGDEELPASIFTLMDILVSFLEDGASSETNVVETISMWLTLICGLYYYFSRRTGSYWFTSSILPSRAAILNYYCLSIVDIMGFFFLWLGEKRTLTDRGFGVFLHHCHSMFEKSQFQ